MLRLDKVIKPWKEAAALNDHINLYGFWNETAFLTKSGDVGMVLRLAGVDYESLDHAEQEYAVKRLESALKAFGPGFHVYQYLFKQNRPEIPFARCEDPVVEAAIDQRRQFFEAKCDRLYQIEIFYCIVLEGARSKTGVGAALARLMHDPAGAVDELRTQFTGSSMKTLLRTQIEGDVARLYSQVQTFTRQLADFIEIEVLNQQGQFAFLRRLVNYDDSRIAGKPQSTQFLDYQVVNSTIEAERDHLRVGDHFVRVLTMKEAITETRPLVLDSLLKLAANFYVVTEWTPMTTEQARKEVNKRRRHFNISKTGFISQMGSDPAKTNPRDVLVDESKQADIENLGDCLRALGDGQQLGDFSLTIVLYGRSNAELQQLVGEFTGVFTNADGNLFVETYNQLNAYFAAVPGNYAMNLRRLYLLNTNYADLSFLFTILPGEKTNAHLGSEYLAVLETDNSTPYFLNLHNGEVAHTLILGMTGSGKSYFCNFILQNAQKYAPLTFIFDVGGSFHSLTSIFGGSYLNVGQEARDFTINPFSLPPTKENQQFLLSFFRVLIEGNEQRYRLDFKEERKLWDAIERVYVLEPEQRTLSNFADIIGELKERLHRWTRGGQHGFLFDNASDTLSFSRFQTFNFAGWGDAPDVLEPLLFYVLHRASNEIADPAKLATFKMFLLDEAWLFIKNETIRNYVVQAQKTWRKHNAAMILATQSIKELQESGMLQIVSESCPTKIFLANPEMDREVYREAFHLNDTELDLIAGLIPPGQMLIRKAQSSKKVQLPYWNPSKELRRKAEAKALAVSLYQPEGVTNRFFVEAPQKIFAHLLSYLPTPEDLIQWMSDPAEIDRRVKGTEYWMLIDPKAPQQRTGVLGSLNMSADSFRLLPKENETTSVWTATKWAETRRGWIFITSRPTMREALRPLISLWIDTLVLRLLNEPMPDQKPVWFVIDELASLQRLPQLHTAITENRKSQNPVILGFQGRSQMEARYGEDAEAMLSQPATKIFLRTTEPRAAKWVSEAIGEVEIERLRETHYDGTRAGRNFALDRQTEPLVLPSEVSGLDDLRGFLKYGNHVARFTFPFIALEEKSPGFDEREMDDLIVPSNPLPVEPEELQGNLQFPEYEVQSTGHQME